MKKIISVLIVAILLVSSLLAVIPVSAADETYKVNWSSLTYDSYSPNKDSATRGAGSNYEAMFTVNKTETSISSTSKSGADECYYIGNKGFKLAEGAKFDYEFKAKNVNATKYAGVPYAVEGSIPYGIYGSFNNTSDDYNGTKSELRFNKGSFEWEYPSSDNRAFPALDLDGGYSSIKVSYDGFKVTVYGKVGGSYKQQGEVITLPEGSYIVFGVLSREGDGRTLSVKDAVVTGKNEAANAIIKAGPTALYTESEGSSGSSGSNTPSSKNIAKELREHATAVQEEHKEANYTAASWKAVKEALDKIATLVTRTDLTQEEADAAKTALDTAVAALVPNTTVDFAKLEAAIKKAEELAPYEIEYSTISYAMVTKAVDDAKTALDENKANMSQSDVDALTEAILGRIEGLIPSGLKVPRPEDSAGTATDIVAESESATDPVTADDGGCGSAVATTAVVVGVVAALGTAIAVKRKED